MFSDFHTCAALYNLLLWAHCEYIKDIGIVLQNISNYSSCNNDTVFGASGLLVDQINIFFTYYIAGMISSLVYSGIFSLSIIHLSLGSENISFGYAK